MRIAWLVPCRYLEVNGNLATIVGGGIDRVWVPTLPPPVPVQVLCAARVVASVDELDEPGQTEPKHTLTSRVYGPDMSVLSKLAQPFGISGEIADPMTDPAVIIPVGVVFEPAEPGQHTIEIAVDDRNVTFPLNIVLGPPPQ